MKLKELFPWQDLDSKLGGKKIKGISDDTRLLKRGEVFFVRKRKNFDIFSVLRKIDGKPLVFVADNKDKEKSKKYIKQTPVIFVKAIEKEFYRCVDTFYRWKGWALQFIGVTGTNAKTTVTSLIHHLLKKSGKKASLIGTVNYLIGERKEKAIQTTPDYLILRKLAQKASQNTKFMVMEVSSHGVSQERVRGLKFSHCIFTNLSRDHLDYHGTMQNYFNAKKALFTSNPQATFIINNDDPYGRKIAKIGKKVISYGLDQKAKLYAKNIKLSKHHSEFDLIWKNKTYKVHTTLLGEHNVSNILAALATLFSLGISAKAVISHIKTFNNVTGRLEQVSPDVFIDYAHTPDALEKVLISLKDIGYDNPICVFGCGGQRDRGKRPLMGEVASRYAKFSFVTSDNPRSEKPALICREIERGFKNNNYSVVVNRKEAIKEALKLKPKVKNSCVLVAGKGHEEYQTIGNKKIPFSDGKVVKKILSNR